MTLPKYRGRYKAQGREYMRIKRLNPEYLEKEKEYRKLPHVVILKRAASKRWRDNHPDRVVESKLKSFKGGGSKHRYFHALRAWSALVRKRDDHICQICLIRDEKNNIAHHILYRSLYEKLSLNLNNGITLCRNCHREVHLLDWFGI